MEFSSAMLRFSCCNILRVLCHTREWRFFRSVFADVVFSERIMATFQSLMRVRWLPAGRLGTSFPLEAGFFKILLRISMPRGRLRTTFFFCGRTDLLNCIICIFKYVEILRNWDFRNPFHEHEFACVDMPDSGYKSVNIEKLICNIAVAFAVNPHWCCFTCIKIEFVFAGWLFPNNVRDGLGNWGTCFGGWGGLLTHENSITHWFVRRRCKLGCFCLTNCKFFFITCFLLLVLLFLILFWIRI